MPCKLRVQIESEFGAVDLYHAIVGQSELLWEGIAVVVN
jgi:hypothetical protein